MDIFDEITEEEFEKLNVANELFDRAMWRLRFKKSGIPFVKDGMRIERDLKKVKEILNQVID